MKKTLLIALAFGVTAAANATIITQWDFNFGNDSNTSTGTLTPAIGTGTASLVGGTTATFASGDASGGSTDPNVGDDSAWNLSTWAPQGTESGQRGAQFAVSTLGYFNVVVSWDQRHSNTVSRYFQFQYSTDGNTFSSTGLAGDGIFMATSGDTWFNNRTVDLTGITGVDNNANFAFRVVAVFEPGGSTYLASNPTGTYATTGTGRFDMVTVQGTEVPEPATLAAIGVGIAGVISRRRKSK